MAPICIHNHLIQKVYLKTVDDVEEKIFKNQTQLTPVNKFLLETFCPLNIIKITQAFIRV